MATYYLHRKWGKFGSHEKDMECTGRRILQVKKSMAPEQEGSHRQVGRIFYADTDERIA